jgi:hypothetical protein
MDAGGRDEVVLDGDPAGSLAATTHATIQSFIVTLPSEPSPPGCTPTVSPRSRRIADPPV